MKNLFDAAKTLIAIDKQRKLLRTSLEHSIRDLGWVKWYSDTWRHKDYTDRLEGFTLFKVLTLINKKPDEIKDFDVRTMYPNV